MARLSAAQRHAISVVAHGIYAASCDCNVEGMKGFKQSWIKGLSPQDRAMVKFFEEELKRIPRDMLQLMEEDRNGSSS